MKKIRSISHYALIFTILLFFGGLLVSCDNFLQTGDFKEQLENDIAYAKAASYEIRVECDSAEGQITTGTLVSKKVSDEFSVEFKSGGDTQFIGWRAYSRTDSGALEPLSSDFIEFLSFNTESDDGIYGAKVRFKKAAKNICIRPYCISVAFFPPYNPAGYEQDTTVRISFNTPVSEESFGDFSCISFSCGGSDISNRYGTPYFSADSKTLFIPTDKSKRILDATSSQDYADVTARLDFRNVTDKNGTRLTYNGTYDFRVNKNVDNVAPKFEFLRIAKTKEDAVNGTNLVTFEDFTNYASGSTASDGVLNHHVKSVWIYVKATDEGSGISAFTVKEKLIRQKDSTVISLPTLYQTQFQNESGSLNFESIFEYTFKGIDDGVVNLAFSVKDMADNNTDFDKTSDLIKDTNCPLRLLGIDKNLKISSSTAVTYNIALLQLAVDSLGNGNDEVLNTDFITDMAGGKYKKSLNPTDGDKYTEKITIVSAEYSYDNENFTSIPEENITIKYGVEYVVLTSMEGDFVYIQFTADKTKDVYLRVTAKDSVGNTGTETLFYNKAINIIACKKDSDKLTFTLDSALTDISDKNIGISGLAEANILGVSLYVEYTDSNGNIEKSEAMDNWVSNPSTVVEFTKIKFGGNNHNISNLPAGTYKFYCIAATAFLVFPLSSSYCGEHFTFDPSQSASTAMPEETSLPAGFLVKTDTPVLNSGKRNLQVALVFGTLSGKRYSRNSNYTYLVNYYHAKTSKADAYDGYATVPESSNSTEISLPCHYCSWNFEVVVINKNGNKRTSNTKTVDLSYDTVSPTFTSGHNTSYSSSNATVLQTNIFKDEGDGLYTDSNGMVPVRYLYSYTNATLGGIKIDWDSPEIMTTYYKSGDNYCEFPFDGTSGKYLYMQIRDKNGNTREQIYTAPECAGKGSLTYSGSSFKLSCPNTLAEMEMYLKAQYVSDGKWVATSSTSSMTRSDDGTSFSANPTFTSTEKESFVRLLAHRNQYACYYPIYIYPGKYTASNFSCSLKGYTQASQGPIIYADKPVLAHTFYCSKNLGNSAEEWLYNGIETGVVQKIGTFTYTSDNLSGVPVGKYYTTVIHYADGTLEMTGVKQK
ncbi:hypothetical protein [Treponema zioleckii]|uniref:hypothetical protein n=1 Tax=Treponema zioleckii TaxID=331680 RepID=UPI00168BF103|nr:hypothetical protein [Treponema zioleckii]